MHISIDYLRFSARETHHPIVFNSVFPQFVYITEPFSHDACHPLEPVPHGIPFWKYCYRLIFELVNKSN